nr:hypothetical protein [uncultured Rhodopila sp.]
MKIVEGAFVEALFPTSERPLHPGLPHICYCLGVRPPLALVAYTTSAVWPAGVPLPLGVRAFTAREAAALNQARAFRLHLNRQARLPLTSAWFPRINAAGQGVIAIAPARLRQELFAVAVDLEKRYRLNVERLGL